MSHVVHERVVHQLLHVAQITVVLTFERALYFDINIIYISLEKNGDHSTECWKVPSRLLRIEQFWQEIDIVLVGREFLSDTTTIQAAPALGCFCKRLNYGSVHP